MAGQLRNDAAEHQDMVSLPVKTVQGMLTLMWTIQSSKPVEDNTDWHLVGFPLNHVILCGDLINEAELALTGRVLGADISSASYRPRPEGE